VVTPFSPTDWKLYFDGENVSLEPSIGNWSFPCRSHYWIRGGEVRWAANMSKHAIEAGRQHDRQRKAAYYEAPSPSEVSSPTSGKIESSAESVPSGRTLPVRIRVWWKSWMK
jgi:hypothetical protein